MPYLRAFWIFSPHLRHFMHLCFLHFPLHPRASESAGHAAGSAEQILCQVFDRVEYFVSACLDELLRDFITFLILFFL